MTDLNEKRRKCIVDHLTARGYPNITPQVVFDEALNMFTELARQNLLQGLSFDLFSGSITQGFIFAQLKAGL